MIKKKIKNYNQKLRSLLVFELNSLTYQLCKTRTFQDTCTGVTFKLTHYMKFVCFYSIIFFNFPFRWLFQRSSYNLCTLQIKYPKYINVAKNTFELHSLCF